MMAPTVRLLQQVGSVSTSKRAANEATKKKIFYCPPPPLWSPPVPGVRRIHERDQGIRRLYDARSRHVVLVHGVRWVRETTSDSGIETSEQLKADDVTWANCGRTAALSLPPSAQALPQCTAG